MLLLHERRAAQTRQSEIWEKVQDREGSAANRGIGVAQTYVTVSKGGTYATQGIQSSLPTTVGGGAIETHLMKDGDETALGERTLHSSKKQASLALRITMAVIAHTNSAQILLWRKSALQLLTTVGQGLDYSKECVYGCSPSVLDMRRPVNLSPVIMVIPRA